MNNADHTSPRLPQRLLQWFCAPHWLEEIKGDLEEQFQAQVQAEGLAMARLTYWRDILLFAARSYVRRQCDAPYQRARGPIMLTHYVKIALRTLGKNRAYTFINVVGLAVGLACCLLIFLFVQHELHYDRFHEHANKIYRVYDDLRMPAGEGSSFNVSAYVGPEVAQAFPEVETFVRLVRPRASVVFAYEGQYYEASNLLYADSTLFEVFSFSLRRGNPRTALTAPFSLVLTETAARTYFGDQDPLGAVLTTNDGQTYQITGLLADVPATSHLQFDGLISMTTAEETSTFSFEDLLDLRFATYLLLHENASASALRAKLPDFVERLIGDAQRQANVFNTFGLVPLRDVYLHAEHSGLGESGSRASLYTFSAIALLTLLIACINFMNLATARSAKRAKEVGVRKVMGARRRQLAAQFLGESILLGLGALALAIGLTWLCLPFFNTLAGATLALAALAHPLYLLGLLGAALGVGMLAGFYPALVLSSFRPAKVLKGQHLTSAHGTALRKILVVFQFAASVVLLVGTGIVYQQLHHMQRQNLGFRTEQMLVINFRGDEQVIQHLDVLKQELTQVPGVVAATASQAIPSRLGYTALALVETADGEPRETLMPVFPVDHDFLDVYNLKLVAGRNFSPDFATDSSEAFLINEAAVRAFGFATPEDALDMPLFEWGQQGRVIGVVNDFHYNSLHHKIEPMNLLFGKSLARFLTLRITTDNLPQTLTAVEAVWQGLVPHRPFDYRFLDDSFDAQYRAEQRFGQIVGAFAGLAILVACLGLLGLATFMAEQRTKEIGIRKVLGASVPQIVLLLSKQFVRLVLVAVVLAVPIAYTTMNRWLEDFAYHIDISWPIFLMAGLAALGIALVTVSYQAMRAALTDPVKSLRYE